MTERGLCNIHFWVNPWPWWCSDLSFTMTAMCCESPQLISEEKEKRIEKGPQIVQPSQNSLSISVPQPPFCPGGGREMSRASLIKWLRGGKKCCCWRRRTSPINLVNGAFHLHIIYKVELDWSGLVRTGWFKWVKLQWKAVCWNTHCIWQA